MKCRESPWPSDRRNGGPEPGRPAWSYRPLEPVPAGWISCYVLRVMNKRLALALLFLTSSFSVIVAQQGGAGAPPSAPNLAANPPRLPLAQRIAHNDPSRYRPSPGVHGGPGQLKDFALFNGEALDTNLWFLHRGILEPKSGIGQHFHNYCEEMFVIFDGEAQFTIDGRTSTLKGPAGAPDAHGPLARDLQRDRQAGPVDEHQRDRLPRRLRRVRSRRWPGRRARSIRCRSS